MNSTKPVDHGYRADIDGLRALAVTPVVLFHLNFPGFRGGYLGVDVFFVISGFLITKIILSELGRGAYSIVGFYERRIRRIFPALVAVIFASSIAAVLLLFPHDLVDYAESLIASLAFVSNIYFWSEVDYFAGPSETKPLLHLWSLAVEEQFYILFPLLLSFSFKFKRSVIQWACWLITFASFAFCIWLSRTAPAAAFYFAPSRAWELLIGALLALGAVPAFRHRYVGELIGLAGVGLIMVSMMVAKATFDPWAAFGASVGAGLVIYSGSFQQTAVSRALSLRPIVFVGLISYSLYLWHWPIQAFYRYEFSENFSRTEKLTLLVVCFAVAIGSWRFIEKPFRSKSALSRARTFRIAVSAMAVFAVMAGGMIYGRGLAGRYPAKANEIAEFGNLLVAAIYREGSCFLSSNSDDHTQFDGELCLSRDPLRSDYLLMGDSHAAALWGGISEAFPEIHFQQVTASGCKPILKTSGPKRCTEIIENALIQHIALRKSDAVILAARWTDADIEPLLATIAYVRRHVPKVYVIGPIVEYSKKLPHLLAKAMISGDDKLVQREALSGQKVTDQKLKARLAGSGAIYISQYRSLCPTDDCTTLAPNGSPVQWDYGHLTKEGARLIAEDWKRTGQMRDQ